MSRAVLTHVFQEESAKSYDETPTGSGTSGFEIAAEDTEASGTAYINFFLDNLRGHNPAFWARLSSRRACSDHMRTIEDATVRPTSKDFTINVNTQNAPPHLAVSFADITPHYGLATF